MAFGGVVASVLTTTFIRIFLFKALYVVGFGAITYIGINRVLDFLYAQIVTLFSNHEIVGILGLMGADIFINQIFSAYSTVIAIRVFSRFAKVA